MQLPIISFSVAFVFPIGSLQRSRADLNAFITTHQLTQYEKPVYTRTPACNDSRVNYCDGTANLAETSRKVELLQNS